MVTKTATPARIAENLDVCGFALTPEDHAALARLDRADGRIGPDPETFGA